MGTQKEFGQIETGLSRIKAAFYVAHQIRTAALMPYYTLGYPNLSLSMEVIESIAPFCDFIELGIPFSDPIADGPTIQRSTQIALNNGMTTGKCLDMVRDLRSRGIKTPAFLMGYYNPILAYGEERFANEAFESGVEGLIIPDLPIEESNYFTRVLDKVGLALIRFLAPTSDFGRIQQITQKASGFLYMVSVTGVTGERRDLNLSLPELVNKVRSQTQVPIAVGFGISTPEQAALVGEFADGVIVGSALINAVDRSENKPKAAGLYVKSLNEGLLINTS
jgi:tryptophan synthase alpha chain